jgi:hypothetical protein
MRARPLAPPPSEGFQRLARLHEAIRDLDVEHLAPAERPRAVDMLEGLRAVAGWYRKRINARISAEFLQVPRPLRPPTP